MSKYECAFCGKEWATIQERMECEQACAKRVAEEEKRTSEAKKKAKEEASLKEIEAAQKHLDELIKNHVKEFGSIKVTRKFNTNVLSDAIDAFLREW